MAGAGDTIFALATAQGKAGVAIVRLSGEQSIAVLAALGGKAPAPRATKLIRLRDAEGRVLDDALVLRFAEGASFTGEEVVELHLHGSVAIYRAVLRAISSTGLARPAEPGEFTRRALMNDRIDLTQVQGLRDMIEAETEIQRRHAQRVFSGEMAEQVGRWRKSILRAVALVEATIDFADEDVPVDVAPEVRSLLDGVAEQLRYEIAGAGAASRIRTGFEVALVGPPNVGKSSLINALTRSEAAIVSEVAGTTRDVIAVRLDLRGVPVTILDMAGIRKTDDRVESEGVRRAIERAKAADIRIFLREGEDEGGDLMVAPQVGDMHVRTKTDLHGGSGISVVAGTGIGDLLDSLAHRFERMVTGASIVMSDRDAELYRGALIGIEAVGLDRLEDKPELVAEQLRMVARALGRVTGDLEVESVLGEIFASFCIGK